MSKKFDTRDVVESKFPHHGEVLLQVQGEFVISECIGPFNEEIVPIIVEVQSSLPNSGKNRKEILIFSESCLAIEEVFSKSKVEMQQARNSGILPKAVALVIGPEVEGKSLMENKYLDLYSSFMVPVGIFNTLLEAKNWIASA